MTNSNVPVVPPLDWAPGMSDDCYDDEGAAHLAVMAVVACMNLLLGLGLGYAIWGL